MNEIESLEAEILGLTEKLARLRSANPGDEVTNYSFDTLNGPTTLRDLFAGRDKLLVIHNMGQGCRYCTLWADGLNGILAHLESAFSVVLVSKDPPELQRTFANSRHWKFRLASHQSSPYLAEQTNGNAPGAALYELHDDKIIRKNSCDFGPGDLYSPMWPLLALAGLDESSWTPQYRHWSPPQQLDDGGENLHD